MKILILGSGGREYSIGRAIKNEQQEINFFSNLEMEQQKIWEQTLT